MTLEEFKACEAENYRPILKLQSKTGQVFEFEVEVLLTKEQAPSKFVVALEPLFDSVTVGVEDLEAP